MVVPYALIGTFFLFLKNKSILMHAHNARQAFLGRLKLLLMLEILLAKLATYLIVLSVLP